MARRKRVKRTRPLYQKTADALEKMLAGLSPGTFLPSEPDLAKKMGVSRATLREAMRPLEAKGRVVRRQGVGTYVVEPPQVIETGLEVLLGDLPQAQPFKCRSIIVSQLKGKIPKP